MSNMVNPTPELDRLRAEVDALAHSEEQLRAQLVRAGGEVAQRENEIEHAVGELRRDAERLSSTPSAPQTDGERVSNKYLAYQQLIGRIREVIHNTVPRSATVLVASRGDQDLMQLDAHAVWHFPRGADGKYAGYYPKDSAAAIAHLEELRSAGAEYLVFPQTAFWWLEYYAEFKQHLEKNYRVVANREDACMIFALCAPAVEIQAVAPRTTRGRRKTQPSKNGNGKHKS